MANATISKIKVNGVTYDIKDGGALRVSSDTHIGSLTIDQSPKGAIALVQNDVRDGVVPSSTVLTGGIRIYDNNGGTLACFRAGYFTDDLIMSELFASRVVNGSGVYNYMRLFIDGNGNRSYSFSNPTGVLDAIGFTDSNIYLQTNAGVYDGNIVCRKFGKLVEVRAQGIKLKTAVSSATYSLFTLASSMRPYGNVVAYAGSPASTDAAGCIVINSKYATNVEDRGVVSFHKPKGITWPTNWNVNFHVLFMTGDTLAN